MMTYSQYLTNVVSPSAFLMLGTSAEKELLALKIAVTSKANSADRKKIGYAAQLLSDSCEPMVAKAAINALGLVPTPFMAGWLSYRPEF